MLDSMRTLHSLGITDGEIFHSRQTTTAYEYAAGALKSKNTGTDEGFGVRILKEKRRGFSYSSSKSGIADAARAALSLSLFAAPSQFSFAPQQEYRKLDAYEQRAAEVSEKELKDITLQIADAAGRHAEVQRILVVAQQGEAAIANTNLLLAQEKTTSFMAYAEAKDKDGFGFSDYSGYRMLKDPEALGEQAGTMANEMKGPKKLPAGKYPVIFSQDTLSSLLGLLAYSFSGEQRRRKISRLWDKEGQKLFDEKLTIWDDPLADAESRSGFDGEGVASRRMPLIEKGVLRNFYYNREIAALAGLPREGNCARGGYESPPGAGGSNTVIEKGEGEPEQELKKYVYIESMHGLHTANTTSGDFGAEVSVAFLHEGGRKTPVRGFMVSENVFNLFGKIQSVGASQETRGGFIAPKISFRDVPLIS